MDGDDLDPSVSRGDLWRRLIAAQRAYEAATAYGRAFHDLTKDRDVLVKREAQIEKLKEENARLSTALAAERKRSSAVSRLETELRAARKTIASLLKIAAIKKLPGIDRAE